METRSRFSNQAKDPFAGSVLFGSGSSPVSQSHSPVMAHQSTYGMSPMQAMDGIRTIRSPYQAKRFGDTAPLSAKKTPGTARRPPLSSLLDSKPTFGQQSNTGDDFPELGAPTGPVLMSPGLGSVPDSNRKFPLFSAEKVRFDLASPAPSEFGRTGLAGSAASEAGSLGRGFASPAPARPPLRSVFDGLQGRTTEIDGRGVDDGREGNAQGVAAATSPVLTLGPYTPSMDRLDAGWKCWVVVSGFYPSPAAREAVLRQFLQFGDVLDHVLTQGNWLFIRYASPIHAERAASQHGTLFNRDTLLSVLVLNPRLAEHLGIEMTREGALVVDNCTAGVSEELHVPSGAGAGVGLGGGLRQRNGGGGAAAGDREERAPLVGGDLARQNGGGDGSGRRGAASAPEPELYLQPHRRKSLCERLVEYFFSY